MASLNFLKTRSRWQIRWHITDPSTRKVEKGSKLLPAGTTKKQAEGFLQQVQEHQQSIKLGIVSMHQNSRQAIDQWLIFARSFTARTFDHYSRVIEKFYPYIERLRIDQITAAHIQMYQSDMLSRGVSNRTVNAHLTAIKSFCRWLSDTHNIVNPAAKVQMLKEAPPKQRFLSQLEYDKIMASMELDIRDWFIFIANTGLRVSEFCNLTHNCISPDFKSMAIIGKGRKPRVIPLNEPCRNILKKTEATSIFIFQKNGKQIHAKYLSWRSNKIATNLGLEAFGPHAFRHYFATQLIVQGCPLNLVAKILGHSSVKTTERVYLHVTSHDLIGLTDSLELTARQSIAGTA